MTAEGAARLSLVLSVITLALVAVLVVLSLRPPPEPVDLTPLRDDVATLQRDVDDVRLLVEAGGDGGNGSRLAEQLDRLEASVAALSAKVEAICGAIESSPFAPSGFACP